MNKQRIMFKHFPVSEFYKNNIGTFALKRTVYATMIWL